MADLTLPQLLAEVSHEIGSIEKGGIGPSSMGSFRFVQETAVMAKLKPLLDARQIILRPVVEDVRLDLYARTGGTGGPGVLATITMALYAVRGAEEHLLARTVGQGADTQDKAVAKATTAAKKQALLIAFSVPTGDDPEAVSLDEQGQPTRSRSARPRATAQPTGKRAKMARRIGELMTELASQHRRDANVHSVREHIRRETSHDSLSALLESGTDAELEALGKYLAAKVAETEAEAPQAAPPDEPEDDDLPDMPEIPVSTDA